jgi:hypothetical protein
LILPLSTNGIKEKKKRPAGIFANASRPLRFVAAPSPEGSLLGYFMFALLAQRGRG